MTDGPYVGSKEVVGGFYVIDVADPPFQYQAAIAALHATAPTFAATDWTAVLRLYDVLLRHQPTALVALNRAIALDRVRGPAAALEALDAIPVADDLVGDVGGYVYFHSARSDLLARLGRPDAARTRSTAPSTAAPTRWSGPNCGVDGANSGRTVRRRPEPC